MGDKIRFKSFLCILNSKSSCIGHDPEYVRVAPIETASDILIQVVDGTHNNNKILSSCSRQSWYFNCLIVHSTFYTVSQNFDTSFWHIIPFWYIIHYNIVPLSILTHSARSKHCLSFSRLKYQKRKSLNNFQRTCIRFCWLPMLDSRIERNHVAGAFYDFLLWFCHP